MTGTTSGRGTPKRAAASPASRPATARPAATSTPPAPAAGVAPAAGTPRTLSIRMPLVTITFGPQPAAPVPVPAQPTASGARSATLERLAFYGGVAAAGAVGALEWPVAVAVAAGTWVAQHTLPAPRRPSDSAPADGTSAAAASAAGDAGTSAPAAAGTGAAGRG